MSLLLVHNPTSGTHGRRSTLKELETLAHGMGVAMDVYSTRGKDDDIAIGTRLETGNYEQVLAMGGDGTVNLVARVAREHGVLTGIIPAGTANGLAKDLEIPSDPGAAFTLAVQRNKILALDMILVNNRFHVVHVGDVGANTELLKRMESSRDGKLHDAMNFFRQFATKEQFRYQLEVSGKEITGKADMIAFCNARRYGTGIPLTPSACPSDGAFELVIFEKIRIRTLVNSALAAIQDYFFNTTDRKIITTREATLTLSNAREWQVDGEVMPPETELHLELLPRQVNVVCGQECPYESI